MAVRRKLTKPGDIMNRNRYIIYLRKSRTDIEAEQRGEGETLARHKAALLELAKGLKLNVVEIYSEVVSGETIASRPVMQQLLSEVERGEWDGVLVMEVERLARGDTIDQGIVAQTFKYSGTKIITPAKTYDPNNEFDEEYFEFGLFMSRREYKTINRRLQAGRLASVNEGKFVGSIAPYGYKRIKLLNQKGFTLEPIEEEAAVVELIFIWYTKGELYDNGTYRRLGVSLIARKLNLLGIKPRKTDAWTAATIRDILTNPVYTGMIRWNHRPTKKKVIRGNIIKERPVSENTILIKGLHTAIIKQDVFDFAQALMAKNPPKPVGERYTVKNPLAGIVECGMCGRKMIRRPYSDRVKYDTLMCSAPHCKNVSARLSDVENSILDALEMVINEYQIQLGANAKPDNTKLKVIGKNIEETNNKLQELKKQLNKVYEFLETGVYSSEQFMERSGLLAKQIDEINTTLDTLNQEYRDEVSKLEGRSELIPKIENILNVYKMITSAQEKNNLLKEVLEKVVYLKEKSARYKNVKPDDFMINIYPKLINIKN